MLLSKLSQNFFITLTSTLYPPKAKVAGIVNKSANFPTFNLLTDFKWIKANISCDNQFKLNCYRNLYIRVIMNGQNYLYPVKQFIMDRNKNSENFLVE